MYAVGRREDVEETAGLIAGDVYALCHKLAPSNQLSSNKEEPQSGCKEPELPESCMV
jgi:hypothetical protein